jgi:hypothetical protein
METTQQTTNLLKQTVEVDMNYVSRVSVEKNILQMPVSQPAAQLLQLLEKHNQKHKPNYKSDHGHHCCRSPIRQSTREPGRRLRERLDEPVVENRGEPVLYFSSREQEQ